MLLAGPGDLREARDRAKHIDGGKASLVGDSAVENDMAVERPADGVGDGIVMIVAVDKDGKNPGDRTFALFARSGALEKLAADR